MLGLAGRIFGTEKALDSAVKSAASAIDYMVYTDQEKAEARARLTNVIIDWMKATQGQNLARRVLAFAIAGTWLGNKILASMLSVIGIWMVDPASMARVDKTVEVAQALSEDMTGAVGMILTFYFSLPTIGKVADSVMSKWINKEVQRQPAEPPPYHHPEDLKESP